MKKISSFIILLIAIFSCHAQQGNMPNVTRSNSAFVNEFLNNFSLCFCPYITKELSPDILRKNYTRILKDQILKYISQEPIDIGYDYVIADFDHPENSKPGYAEYRYYYLCQFNIKNYHPIMYVKDEVDDSTLVYLANFSAVGKCLDKLQIYCFKPDQEIRKSVINADFTVKICKYEPIDNYKKTKITIYHYKMNLSTGKFDYINEESKTGERSFTRYLFSKESIPDDPINQ